MSDIAKCISCGGYGETWCPGIKEQEESILRTCLSCFGTGYAHTSHQSHTKANHKEAIESAVKAIEKFGAK